MKYHSKFLTFCGDSAGTWQHTQTGTAEERVRLARETGGCGGVAEEIERFGYAVIGAGTWGG